ncbi:guanine nucleotide exchange factor DBS [Scaptodrosophila lebanonensis]|uniref:Guanine nucleotide exchange factor DBS n=1 Tax=Drosophila lebanonensis TaxID=7225 RepID=A0A6J2TC04_DROLE|nr:guanine nucleotide exchange factor DBS [Scaptodrosophila lebanonensis]
MFTPRQKKVGYGDSPHTPMNFSRELRQVLQERNLLTAKSRKKVCRMLDSNSSSPIGSPNPNAEAGKRMGFRRQAIEEIVMSEKSYLEQLELLMNYFVRPIKEQAIIDGPNHTALFGQIEMIYNLNGEFLRELEANVENVSQAFLKMAPFFKLYSVYAFDYRSALFILQELISKNPVFRKFLEQTESRPEVQRKLNSLMIVPIQRVPRYKLLLEQVLLYTSPADTDYRFLKESVKEIEATASHINSCVEEQEVTQYLIHLQNSLVNRTPNIVNPSRRVIKEGMLQKITHKGTEIRRYCVLMSDIFMYCKVLKERAPNTVVENSLECCCIFPLKKCKVYEMLPGNFKLTCQNDGIIFGTSDLQVARTWVGFIRDAIDLHVQCRKTLRKDSSKRTPIRKKDVKKFGADYVLSPNKRKSDYDTVFRNNNRATDSEDEADDNANGGCFSRKRKLPKPRPVTTGIHITKSSVKAIKRPAPPPPPPPPTTFTAGVQLRQKPSLNTSCKENRISKLCKMIANGDKVANVRGILKRTNTTTTQANTSNDQDPSYGFASRFSDSKSYFRAHNVDNTIPTAVKREDLFAADVELGNGNFQDVLFPLRSSGGSQKSGGSSWSTPAQPLKESNRNMVFSPPQKKRVKFDETLDELTDHEPKPFVFPSGVVGNSNKGPTLRERVYDFFANLF